MKSSSELFPVTLLSAELKDDWNEDTYLLKPNNSHDSTVEFALTRFGLPDRPGQTSVLWLPHFLTGRLEWLEEWSDTLKQLLQEGYDVWFLEWRGHGASNFNSNWARNTLYDLAQCDLPATCSFIREQVGHAPLVVADRSAAQVWVAAHEVEDNDRDPKPNMRGALLLWPQVGKVPLSRYAKTMGWEDVQLALTRHAVRRAHHHETLNRMLFDELLLGQPARLRRWNAPLEPNPFCVVDDKSQEKAVHKWLDSMPAPAGAVRFIERSSLDAALLARWLGEVSDRAPVKAPQDEPVNEA